METTTKAALAGTLSTLGIGGLFDRRGAADLLGSGAGRGPLCSPRAPPTYLPSTTATPCAPGTSTHALSDVGPWGWGGRRWPLLRSDVATQSEPSTAGADSAREVAHGATGTNTQEVGVDEPDVAKTDGKLVLRLLDGRRLVVTDVTGAEPRQVSEWRVPGTGQAEACCSSATTCS